MMETVPKGPHVLAVLRIEEEEKEDISMDEFKPETPKTKKMNSGIKIWRWDDIAEVGDHYNQVRKSILKARPGSETPHHDLATTKSVTFKDMFNTEGFLRVSKEDRINE